jgi:transcriptional regulator with XRE-family HTH domain
MSTEPAIGLAIRRYRTAAASTLADLARRVGTDEAHLSRIENGLVHPRPLMLTRIAAALGIPPPSLLQEFAMPAPASGFLSLAAVAAELETTELAIARIISRRALPASRVGADGPFRVAAAELAGYIGRNCPDLAPPSIAQGWIADDADRAHQLGYAFYESIIAAAADQVRPKEEAPSADPSKPIPLKLTDAIRAAILKKPPKSIVTPRHPPRLFPDMRCAYIVTTLRTLARAILNVKSPERQIVRLYESPEAYQATTAEAVKTFLARSLSFTSMHLFGKPEQKTWTAFQYSLAHTVLAAPPTMDVALALAF